MPLPMGSPGYWCRMIAGSLVLMLLVSVRAADEGGDLLGGTDGSLAQDADGLVAGKDASGLWLLASKPGAELQGEEFAGWLQRNTERVPAELRPMLALVASRFHHPAAAPVLRTWLTAAKANDVFLRETVVWALGHLGDRAAAPALQALAASPDDWTRYLATEALARVQGTWRAPPARWAGKAARLVVVGRYLSAEETHYYQELVRQQYAGECQFFGLAAPGPGSIGGWARNGRQGLLDVLGADAEGRLRADVVILHSLWPTEVDPFLLWRLHQYAHRGGQVVLDGTTPFGSFVQRELKGTTARGGGIYGKIVRTYTYPRGPWDELFPAGVAPYPPFPSVDGLPPPVRALSFGYRPLGQGGSLLIAGGAASLEGCLAGESYNSNAGIAVALEPFAKEHTSGSERAWPQLLGWLTHGPTWQATTLDWRNEPGEKAVFGAGKTVPLTVAVTCHAPGANLVPRATLLGTDGAVVAEVQGAPIGGPAGTQATADLKLAVPDLAQPGPARLRLVLLDAAGKELQRLDREATIQGRFILALTGAPAVITGDTTATVRLHLTDLSTGPVADGQLRLVLRNDDLGRTYLAWNQPWSGPKEKETTVAFAVALPAALPSGQYTLEGQVGDRHGRTFARATVEIARQAPYDERHLFLWSEWGQYYDEEAAARRRLGLNTSYGYGGWVTNAGAPFEYAVINPPQYTRGVRLGDYYLGRGGGAQDRGEWRQLGQRALGDARAVSVNLIEEVQLADESRGPGRRAQFLYFLQDLLRTTDALNTREGCDILAWEELPFARLSQTRGGGNLAGWFHYDFRDSVLHARGDWLREEDPCLHIEPGMGAGLRSGFYDGMHNRGYVHDDMDWFPLYRLKALPTFGRAPMTWLVGMRGRDTYAPQARVVWSAIAAGGRHLLVYAPGDKYGARLFEVDLSLSASGRAYQEVIQSVRPYEPVLGHVQNAISSQVMSYDWGGIYTAQGGREPALEVLTHLGVDPDEATDVTRYRLIIDSHAGVHDAAAQAAALRQAVTNGAVLLTMARGTPAFARAFGVQMADPQARGAAAVVDLSPLGELLPEVRGARLYGKLGPATGVAADSGLTATPGLIFGQVGRGLFVYVNVDSLYGGAFQGDTTAYDFPGWAALMAGLLRYVLAPAPARPVDALGLVDRRFGCHVLDTDDHSQRYLLVHANDVLEGSLSAWGLTEREPFARWTAPAPQVLAKPADVVTLKWTVAAPAEVLVWVHRRVTQSPPPGSWGPRLFLTSKGQPVEFLGGWREGDAPVVGRLRAEQAAPAFLWEAVGAVMPLGKGEYELRLVGQDRAVEVDEIRVVAAEVTARLEIGETTVRAVCDAGSQRPCPIFTEGGQRFTEVPLRPGGGVVLALLEEPASALQLRLSDDAPAAGQPVAVEATLTDAQGLPLRRSHTLRAQLLGADGAAIPATDQVVLLAQGRTVFDFWIGGNLPPGACQLQVRDLTSGTVTARPLTVRPRAAARIPPVAEWQLGPLPQPPDWQVCYLPLGSSRRSPQWQPPGHLPHRGGEVVGQLTLRAPAGQGLDLGKLSVAAGPGVNVALARAAATVPAGGQTVLPFTVSLAADAPVGRTVLRLVSQGQMVSDLPGAVLEVPPPAELRLEPLPDLREPDLAVFCLVGWVLNRTAAAARLEVVTPLPEVCFPGGRESRLVNAPPDVPTEFHVPVVLTRQTARWVRERDLAFPVQLKGADGAVWASARCRLLTNPWDPTPPVIGTWGGGAALLSVLNATDQPRTVDVTVTPPAGLTLMEHPAPLTLPPHQTGALRLPCRRQGPGVSDGMYFLPYQVGGQVGEVRVELRTQSWWWVTRRDVAPKVETTATLGEDVDPALKLGELESAGPWTPPHEVFRAADPPAGWHPYVFGTAIHLGAVQPLPKWGDLVVAATCVEAPADQEVKISVARETGNYVWLDQQLVEDRREQPDQKRAAAGGAPPQFLGYVWLNGELVYDSRPVEAGVVKPRVTANPRLKPGRNTLLVQCLVGPDSPEDPGRIFVFFHDAKTGQRVRQLTWAMTPAKAGGNQPGVP